MSAKYIIITEGKCEYGIAKTLEDAIKNAKERAEKGNTTLICEIVKKFVPAAREVDVD